MHLWLLMNTLLNPADYGIPSGVADSIKAPGIKILIGAILEFLDSQSGFYLNKVDFHILRECEASEYFLYINMYNMYTLQSGGSSLDYQANVGL